MCYEQLVLAPSLSFLHDVVAHSESTLDWLEDPDDPPNREVLAERIFAAYNTVKGVFALLSNRYTMLQLGAGMESDATTQGGVDTLRAKLAFMKEKVHAGTEGLVTNSVLTKWLKKFDNTKAKAVMNTHAKASATTSTFRDRRGGGKGKGVGKGEGGRDSDKGGEGEEQKGSMASGWRQQRSATVDHAWSSHAMDHGAAKALRSWGVFGRRHLRAAGVDARGDGAVSTHGRLGTCTSSTACIAGISCAQARNQHVEARDGLQATRRRVGGYGREEHQQGARVIPYMDDFLVITSSQLEAFRARELASRVLTRLGIGRNEKKGQWGATQLVEHHGLEVDLAAGQFRVNPASLQKIHVQAKALLNEASRQRHWLPARKLAGFTGRCQSVYLAVPPARLYLRELYFLLHAGVGLEDELRHLHITYLELEAVYKTVQSFLRKLTGKVVRLYCDNQAVVAMLSHFTSQNLELMRRMRRLNDIELQAWYI
ncbi:hypothetical protein CYMTET_50827 [Cymbomonas tetramitiformis]|uniref:Reverse transcriptase domain-containing protein n=1 Tax=Cymbomonas tetramitiformis TaxID=36881 RepID=A0AAE0ETA8_9CHLO|nr:hypothetical protein CYMTET_50827 [Cymbomonas tetramitiformis]